MKWYILILLLMTYPIIELSRLIYVYYTTIKSEPVYIVEFTLMWLAYFTGMTIMARRLKG